MNYFDLYSSYPDRTIAAAWDSQVKEADTTPWLAGTKSAATSCLPALRHVTRNCAPYPAARGVPSNVALHVPLSWPLSYRNTYRPEDDGYSTEWLGRWQALLYCWHWGKESGQPRRSQ